MRVVAIMTCHNRRELTIRCLQSLFAQATEVELHVVLVDDGSTDGTTEAVTLRYPQVEVVAGSGQLYWAKGMALAEERALSRAPDVLLWLNDDVDLFPGALTLLAQTSLITTPAAVVAGPVVDPTSGRITYGGLRVSRWHPLRAQRVGLREEPVAVDAFNGNVVWVPLAALKAVGGIDGAFSHAYADLDYGLRLRSHHYPTLQAAGAVGGCEPNPAIHDGSYRGNLRSRLAHVHDPKALPFESQVRYLKRHAPKHWLLLVPLPYARAVLGIQHRRPV